MVSACVQLSLVLACTCTTSTGGSKKLGKTRMGGLQVVVLVSALKVKGYLKGVKPKQNKKVQLM